MRLSNNMGHLTCRRNVVRDVSFSLTPCSLYSELPYSDAKESMRKGLLLG